MTWRRALTWFVSLFILLMTAGIYVSPDGVRASNRDDQFDAHAARSRLERILRDETPHPIDSAAQDAVRERLLRHLTTRGFSPELREEFVCRPQPRGPLVDCGYVRNIVFSIGPDVGPAVLAVSHYDSVPASPGASDDGIGISVWLEIARVLSHEDLQRRVVFLFTDGEEQALLGAYSFANDPLMDDVEALVDLEARGSRGPAVFFESNQPNADAVAAYSAVPRPVANSVMADVYRLLPNTTDVTVLSRPGLDVVNIAVLDGVEDYHTANDTVWSQDLESVQHMGDSALAVMRRLAGAPDAGRQMPMAYTDIASRLFVYAPVWVVLATLALSAVVALVAFWRAGTDARWRTFFAPPLAVILAGAFAFAADFVIRLLRPGEDYAFAHPEPTRAFSILFAFAGVVVALMTLRASRAPRQLDAAGMFWFALIGGAASIVASGISILFALPAVAYACGWLVSRKWKRAEAAGASLAALLVLVVWIPTLFLVELALGWDLPLIFAILVTLLLFPGLGMIASVQGEARWRGVAGVLGVAAIAAVIASVLTPAMSEARPRPLNLSYFLNATDNEARMLAGAAERALPRELRGVFEPELILPGDLVETWAAPAEVEEIPAPVLQNITVTEGTERIVRGQLAMNGAYRATIRIPLTASPLRVRVNGVETNFADVGEPLDFMNVACQGRACEGVEIELVLAAEGASDADWFVIGQTPGLQVAAAEAMRARRPANTVPIQFGDSAIALTRFRPGG